MARFTRRRPRIYLMPIISCPMHLFGDSMPRWSTPRMPRSSHAVDEPPWLPRFERRAPRKPTQHGPMPQRPASCLPHQSTSVPLNQVAFVPTGCCGSPYFSAAGMMEVLPIKPKGGGQNESPAIAGRSPAGMPLTTANTRSRAVVISCRCRRGVAAPDNAVSAVRYPPFKR